MITFYIHPYSVCVSETEANLPLFRYSAFKNYVVFAKKKNNHSNN